MDKFIELLGNLLGNLDPGTAIAVLILFLVLYFAWRVIKKLYEMWMTKNKEVDELHKASKEDSDANIKLIMQLQANLDKQSSQGGETRDIVIEMKRTLDELKIKWEAYFKTN